MKKGKPKRTQWQQVLRTCLSFALILTLALGNIVPLNVAKAEGESGASNPFNVDEDATPAPDTSESDKYAPDFLNVDFESSWAEFGPQIGLGESNANPEIYELVTDPADSSNKYLKVTRSGSLVNMNNMFSSISTNSEVNAGRQIAYEYMLSAADMESLSANVKLFAANNRVSHLRLRGNGKIWFNNASAAGTPFATLSVGEWTKICIIID